MNDNGGSIGECGLHCFGSISASISHELKNALAIINENAGLLEDLSFMAEKGMPLDPGRLKNLAANIGKQILRADGIIRNMNRFAHSTDETVQRLHLGEALELTVSLTSRMAAMKGIAIRFQPHSEAIFVTTRLFYLENLIWLFLKEIFEKPGPEKELVVSLRPRENGAAVVFSPVDAMVEGRSAATLLDHLKAVQVSDSASREIGILLPSGLNGC